MNNLFLLMDINTFEVSLTCNDKYIIKTKHSTPFITVNLTIHNRINFDKLITDRNVIIKQE